MPAPGVYTNGPTDQLAADRAADIPEAEYEKWRHWPVNWTAIFVGSLAAIAAVTVFGLIGVAIGAHLLSPDHRIVELKKIGIGALIFSVFAAFLAFVIGGWVAGKIAGILRSEPGMLHGAIVWLVALPLLLTLTAVGAGSSFGGWFAGLAGSPTASAAAPFDAPEPLTVNATTEERTQYRTEMAEYRHNVKQWKDDSPKVARNSALGGVTALMLGLMGSVIGGWMASGEPMTLTHHRTRPRTVPLRRERF